MKNGQETGLLTSFGFTLLELLVVLFLVTLIAGLSALSFSGGTSAGRLDSTARELVSLLKHSRSYSMTHGEAKPVVIDLDAGTYGLEGKTAKRFAAGMSAAILDPFSGEKKTGRHIILFNPAGGMEGEAILIADRSRSIIVRPDPVLAAIVEKGQ